MLPTPTPSPFVALERLRAIAQQVERRATVAYERGHHARKCGWARITPYDDFRDRFWLAGYDNLPQPEF